VGIPTVFGAPIQNYPHLVNELARIGYNGYLCWEFCHIVKDAKGKPGTLKEVDEQTKLALEYMRGLVAAAEKLHSA
jgi:sugar phosphate isomerase/epimerase